MLKWTLWCTNTITKSLYRSPKEASDHWWGVTPLNDVIAMVYGCFLYNFFFCNMFAVQVFFSAACYTVWDESKDLWVHSLGALRVFWFEWVQTKFLRSNTTVLHSCFTSFFKVIHQIFQIWNPFALYGYICLSVMLQRKQPAEWCWECEFIMVVDKSCD